MRKLLILIIPLIIAGLALGAGLARRRHAPQGAPAYTLTRQRTITHADGTQEKDFIETEWQDSAGNVRRVRRNANGNVIELGGDTASGSYVVTPDGTQYDREGDFAPAAPLSASEVKASPQFLRTDYVLGEEAIVIRPVAPKTLKPDERVELWYMPSLGPAIVKSVTRADDGTTYTIEALSITHGEPPPGAARLRAGLTLRRNLAPPAQRTTHTP